MVGTIGKVSAGIVGSIILAAVLSTAAVHIRVAKNEVKIDTIYAALARIEKKIDDIVTAIHKP